MTMKCIGNSCEQFKSIQFKFKNMKYSFKLLDVCNFLKGSLSELSEKLPDEYKIVTKHHFPDNFELLKRKAHFPYEWVKKNTYTMKNYQQLINFILV